jgi:hypothetical protein
MTFSMKSVLIPAATILMTLPAQAALIASWSQDESSGDLIDGTGGHANAALVTGGSVNYSQPGVPNGTYGSLIVSSAVGTSIGYGPSVSDDYFISGTSNANPVMDIPNTGAFTVMSWINPTVPDLGTGRTYRPISTGSGSGVDRGWGFGLRLPNTTGAAAIRFTTYGIADNDSDPFNVVFGEWVHIAATYNNGAINYYLNGNLLTGGDTSVFGQEGVNSRLTIGGRLGALAGGAGGNDGDQVNGLLDGIRVYDSVLTETEIRSAAIAGVIPEPAVTGSLLLALGFAGFRRRR